MTSSTSSSNTSITKNDTKISKNDTIVARKVPDTIISTKDVELYFKENNNEHDCYPLRYKGREYIFERLIWVRNLPKDIEEDLITVPIDKKKIWDVLNSTVYQYYSSYTALSSSAKRKYGFLLKENEYVYFKISSDLNIIKELYLSCFLYFQYNSLLGGYYTNTVTLYKGDNRIKIDVIGHLSCCDLYTSYLVKSKKDTQRKILVISSNPIQEAFMTNRLKKENTVSGGNVLSSGKDYTLYGFPVMLLSLESNNTLHNLSLSFKKGNTIERSYQMDSYHIFNDMVNSMKIYQKYGVHNGICPQNIYYDNKTDRYYLISYSSFTKYRLPSGYKRKTFIKIWKSQVKRYHCVTNVKYDLLELGFILNWVEMKKLKLENSVKIPVTRNMRDYFEYVNELNSNAEVGDKIRMDLGKILRRLDRKLANGPTY